MRRTTVSMPLHGSAQWIDVIAGNIERLAPVSQVVVSDVSSLDDTLDVLRARFGGHPGVEFLEPRAIAPGWVSHCNDLLARARTPFGMWLPHDDDVDQSWITEGERLLDADPSMIAAVGDIVMINQRDPNAPPWRIALLDEFGAPAATSRAATALRATLIGDASSLGLLYRAMVRTSVAPALPTIPADGHWADVFWGIQLVVRGGVVRMPTAEYRKRLHAGNTHSLWGNLLLEPTLREEHLPRALADLQPAAVTRLLAEAWTAEALELRGRGVRSDQQVHDLNNELADRRLRERELQDELDRQAGLSAAEYARLRQAFESSTSWRITRPLRALRRRQ